MTSRPIVGRSSETSAHPIDINKIHTQKPASSKIFTDHVKVKATVVIKHVMQMHVGGEV
jgi:hypothetical protein